MRTNNKETGLQLSHLINKINYELKKNKKTNVDVLWFDLCSRLKKISWDEKLIEIYNKDFYDTYVKSGFLKKNFEYNNGLPKIWGND